MQTYIFGAKATAAGLFNALSVLEPDIKVEAFLVFDAKANVSEIYGCPVKGVADVPKENSTVYVAVPELIHDEITIQLESLGFDNIIPLDSKMEADLMEKYFEKNGKFKSVHSLNLNDASVDAPKVTIYAASFYKDKSLKNPPEFPHYIKKIFLGCHGAYKNGIDISNQADFYDNDGDDISDKNPNRCEMTAHYWVWKNRMNTDDEYVGICHYRRLLDLSDDDLKKIKENDIDVVLPFPMIHYPNAGIQHSWYVPEKRGFR